jgi:hypothetical protein
MDAFIHRENVALFRRRLAERDLTEDQRNIVLTLLKEAHVKGPQPTPVAEGTSIVAPHLGNGGRRERFARAEAERASPQAVQRADVVEQVAAQRPEHRQMPRHTSSETGRSAAVVLESGHAQAREIVEARLLLIADLEQRPRLPCDGEPDLTEGA